MSINSNTLKILVVVALGLISYGSSFVGLDAYKTFTIVGTFLAISGWVDGYINKLIITHSGLTNVALKNAKEKLDGTGSDY